MLPEKVSTRPTRSSRAKITHSGSLTVGRNGQALVPLPCSFTGKGLPQEKCDFGSRRKLLPYLIIPFSLHLLFSYYCNGKYPSQVAYPIWLLYFAEQLLNLSFAAVGKFILPRNVNSAKEVRAGWREAGHI